MNTRRALLTVAILGLLTLSAVAGCMPASIPATPSETAQPPAAGDPAAGAALTWEREGGIAGFCDQLTVFANGSLEGRNCKGPVMQSGKLTDEQRAQLEAWLAQYSACEFIAADDAVADAMSVRVTLAGQGDKQPTAEEQQALQEFAAQVYAGVMPVAGPTPTPEVFSPVPDDARATGAARDALAAKLGVSIEDMTVGEVTVEQWRDSCLGLGGPDEMCLQAITPGFKVMVTVDGKEYEVRTSQDATVVRIADTPDTEAEAAPAVPAEGRTVDAARDALAEELGAPIEKMTLREVTAQDWPDSCLGLAGSGEMCAQMITPGYKVTLTVDGQEYEVRTNEDASVVRIAES